MLSNLPSIRVEVDQSSRRHQPSAMPPVITAEHIRMGSALIQISAAELGRKAGVAATRISRCEKGSGVPQRVTVATLNKIREALEAEGVEFPAEGEGWTGAGQDIVEPVPMPMALREAIAGVCRCTTSSACKAEQIRATLCQHRVSPASETNRSRNTIFSDPGPDAPTPSEKSGLAWISHRRGVHRGSDSEKIVL
jgi:hypothetical protein